MGLYRYIALVGLEESPRRMFLCSNDVNDMHMLALHVDDPR